MHPFVRKFLLSLLFAGISVCVSAQFYQVGDDPWFVPWNTISTDNYQIIYPVGMDSLARVYGRELETWRRPVGNSAGFLPGEWTKGKLPVVLHGYHAVSNGSVAWAPRRMDLYLSPDAYHPTPMPWIRNLAIHEQRHAAQMQAGLAYAMRPFGWFFGEMVGGGAAGLFGGKLWMEGDAVVTETALSNSGRGRQASFLNYYMIAMDQEVQRSWWSWKYGSQRWYTPNHYAAGYMILSGVRYNDGIFDIAGRRYVDFSHHPFHWGLGPALKRFDGKSQDAVFTEASASHYCLWVQNAARRAPYIESTPEVGTQKWYTTYSGNVMTRSGMYSVKESLVRAPALVRIDENGKEKRLRPFSASCSGLQISADSTTLVWSETVRDPRWSLKSTSRVRTYDLGSGRVRTLNRKGQVYNPAPADCGAFIGSRYDYAGSTGVVLMSGKKTLSYDKAPDGCQVVETASIDGHIYASVICEEGLGICEVVDGTYNFILQPQPVTIAEMKARDGRLWFSSDRNGVDELYCLDPQNGMLLQVTSTRYGSRDHVFSEDGKWLHYSLETLQGRLPHKTPADSLIWKEVSFADHYAWEVADTLSAQEARIATEPVGDVAFSDEKPYHKISHLLHLHSWAPVYFDYDNIKSFSMDSYYETAVVGLTGLLQNNLGTMVMSGGYCFHNDPDKGSWRHSGHLKFTYTGWYPVIEASVDVNDRRAHEVYFKAITTDGKSGSLSRASRITDGKPLVTFSTSVYIPWSFSRGGWYSGFIPKVKYSISNDIYNTTPEWYQKEEVVDEDGNKTYKYTFLRKGTAVKYPSQTVLATLRGYVTQNTAESGIYPRFGAGLEIGYYQNISRGGLKTTKGEMSLYSPQGYAYAYMYLPGMLPEQGMKLTAKYGTDLSDNKLYGSTIVNTLPRGLSSNSELMGQVCVGSRSSLLLTADYGIPIWIGDLSIFKSFAYINRLEITPHFDYMMFWMNNYRGELFSAGADLNIKFSDLLWIMAPVTVGVRLDYNGGSSFAALKEAGIKMGHFYAGPLFTVDF